MADDSLDFAIFGTSPLAALAAGLLALVHGRTVCLVSESRSEFRLARRLDLSVGAHTRPETWALLAATVPETVRLITSFAGRQAVARLDPLFVCETPQGIEALSHVRHVAAGLGQVIERAGDLPGQTGHAYRFRDARLLVPAPFERALPLWLSGAGVRQVQIDQAGVTLRRDGSCRIQAGDEMVTARQAVLCDGAMILRLLEPDERDRALVARRQATIVTEPTRALPAPVVLFPDQLVALHQRPNGGVTALADGRADSAALRIGKALSGQGTLRRAGQMDYRYADTGDGAPLVGPARGLKTLVAAGMGTFFAAALARHLAGASSPDEAEYFTARATGGDRSLVADYRAPSIAEPVP